jgi:hypothetical protein
MAALSESELTRTVRLMVDHYGLDRLRDRFANLGAFKSRRGVNTPEQLADRLYRLSGGLRRQAIPTYAFSSLWAEMLQAKVGEEGEKRLEELADKVNACLGSDERVVEGKDAELDQALAAYRETLASITGPEVADADMLLKAVPAVAIRLRASQPAEG